MLDRVNIPKFLHYALRKLNKETLLSMSTLAGLGLSVVLKDKIPYIELPVLKKNVDNVFSGAEYLVKNDLIYASIKREQDIYNRLEQTRVSKLNKYRVKPTQENMLVGIYYITSPISYVILNKFNKDIANQYMKSIEGVSI